MPGSTSHKGPHSRGAHGSGQGDGGAHDEGGGGGGGGGGKLVRVAFARNQAEAELLQGLLLDSGIPSVLKRAGGFDNPDFLAAGPHDIWVNVAHEEEAKRMLAETIVADEDEEEDDERRELEAERRLARGGRVGPSPAQLGLWVLGAAIAAVALIWVLYEIT